MVKLNNLPPIGSRIRVLVNCDDDLSNEGMGIQRCANKGDELIVRGHYRANSKTILVSHKDITNSSFCVFGGEYELVDIADN